MASFSVMPPTKTELILFRHIPTCSSPLRQPFAIPLPHIILLPESLHPRSPPQIPPPGPTAGPSASEWQEVGTSARACLIVFQLRCHSTRCSLLHHPQRSAILSRVLTPTSCACDHLPSFSHEGRVLHPWSSSITPSAFPDNCRSFIGCLLITVRSETPL